MELVYLWVEDYKNIHRQGFNFSPKFDCKYNPDTNELTIDENDDYIENFFGDNINVTAIVGKNGSGKSSVLNHVYSILNNRENMVGNFFCLYRKDNEFLAINRKSISNYEVYRIQDIWFDQNINEYYALWINYQKNIDYINAIYTNQSKFHCVGGEILIYKHIHVFNKYKDILDVLKGKYLFNNFQIKMTIKSDSILSEEVFNHTPTISQDCIDISNSIVTKFNNGENYLLRKSINSTPLSFDDLLGHNCFLFYIHFNISSYNEIIEIVGSKYFKESLNIISTNTTIDSVFEVLNNFKEELSKTDNSDLSRFFNKCLEGLIFIKKYNKKFKLSNGNYIWELSLSEKKIIDNIIMSTQYLTGLQGEDSYLINFIEYDFVNSDKKITYNSLSDGEKIVLKISLDMIHHLDLYSDKNVLFIIDEIDNALHPKWKKEILSIQLKIYKKFIELNHKTNIHLLFTTHSPFLLSDIPKQNIIFLDKDENGHCKVVDGLKEKKQTFGANIHTLLSDSFFMDDGLMGEFAKGKINEIINNLNDKNHTYTEKEKTKVLLTIESIGEPFLKSKLLDMYNRRFIDDYKIREQKRIDEQIRILQEKREKLND